jgi:hypothetical protein
VLVEFRLFPHLVVIMGVSPLQFATKTKYYAAYTWRRLPDLKHKLGKLVFRYRRRAFEQQEVERRAGETLFDFDTSLS